jgi:hypothetical protein
MICISNQSSAGYLFIYKGDLRLSGQCSSTGMNSFGFTFFCDVFPLTESANSSNFDFFGLISTWWGSAFTGAALALRLGAICDCEWIMTEFEEWKMRDVEEKWLIVKVREGQSGWV